MLIVKLLNNWRIIKTRGNKYQHIFNKRNEMKKQTKKQQFIKFNGFFSSKTTKYIFRWLYLDKRFNKSLKLFTNKNKNKKREERKKQQFEFNWNSIGIQFYWKSCLMWNHRLASPVIWFYCFFFISFIC